MEGNHLSVVFGRTTVAWISVKMGRIRRMKKGVHKVYSEVCVSDGRRRAEEFLEEACVGDIFSSIQCFGDV